MGAMAGRKGDDLGNSERREGDRGGRYRTREAVAVRIEIYKGGAAAPHSKTLRDYGAADTSARSWSAALLRRLGFALVGIVLTVSCQAAEWEAAEGYRSVAVTVNAPGKPGFTLLALQQTGVTFSNFVADLRSITNRNLLSGSGVAAGDVDGDGWCDLYFCGLDSENVLYRNRGGWKFEDITPPALACKGDDSTAAAF